MPGNLNTLIQTLYQTAEDDTAWNVVSGELRRLTGASKTVFALRDWSGREVFDNHVYGFENGTFDLYEEYYYSVDIWTSGLAQMPTDRFHAHHHFLRDQRYLNSEVYTDYAKKNDIRYLAGCVTDIPGTNMFAQLATVRGHDGEDFSDDLLAQLDLLTPHFRQAILLKERIRSLEGDVRSRERMVNKMPEAAFVVSENGQVLYNNASAQNLLSTSKMFRSHGRKLALSSPEPDGYLGALVKGACSARAGEARSPGGSFQVTNDKSVYEIMVHPFRFRLDGDATHIERPSALVIVSDSTKRISINEDALKQRYNLTKSETAIIRLLSSELTPLEIAAERGTSLNTVRTQIRDIHQKTGCKNQSQLMSRVLGGVSRLS